MGFWYKYLILYIKLRYVIWYNILVDILICDMDILSKIVISMISYHIFHNPQNQLSFSVPLKLFLKFWSQYFKVSHDLGMSFWFAMDSHHNCEPLDSSIQLLTTFMNNNEVSCHLRYTKRRVFPTELI